MTLEHTHPAECDVALVGCPACDAAAGRPVRDLRYELLSAAIWKLIGPEREGPEWPGGEK